MRSISLIPQILLEVESCNFMWEVSGGYYRLVNLRKSLVKFAHFRQGVRSVFFCVVNLSIVAYNLRTFRSGVTMGGGGGGSLPRALDVGGAKIALNFPEKWFKHFLQ